MNPNAVLKSNPYIQKSKTNLWGTPNRILEQYEDWFDPCPYPRPKWDGLTIDWLLHEKIYCNPPYDNIKAWAKKCYKTLERAIANNQSIEIHLLIPTRTDTQYFHSYIYKYADLEFIKGRLKFRDLASVSKKLTSAPFASMICIYKNKA